MMYLCSPSHISFEGRVPINYDWPSVPISKRGFIPKFLKGIAPPTPAGHLNRRTYWRSCIPEYGEALCPILQIWWPLEDLFPLVLWGLVPPPYHTHPHCRTCASKSLKALAHPQISLGGIVPQTSKRYCDPTHIPIVRLLSLTLPLSLNPFWSTYWKLSPTPFREIIIKWLVEGHVPQKQTDLFSFPAKLSS